MPDSPITPALRLAAAPASAPADAQTRRRSLGRRGMAIVLIAAGLAGLASTGGCVARRPIDDLRADAADAVRWERWDVAAADYGEIVDRYPGDWRGQYGFGLASLELGDWDAAELALKTAHELQPRRDDIADAYAEALFRTNSRERLIAFLRGQTDGGDEQDWLRLASFERRIGDLDAAYDATDTAIRLFGRDSAGPYIEAHRLALLAGDKATALRRLRQAYGLDPSNTEVAAAIRSLGETPGLSFALPPGV